ncbi:chemotaxis protein CheC [Candidatus Woesearchaeota archaeon]|nr:chemotaxis protein CheC [Candidatus Woesearchaeota archaeon]
MKDLLNLNDMEKDALKELGNVGTGNAATALSQLLKRHIEIIIPETKFVPIEDFTKEFGGPEKVVVSTYLEIGGDLTGEALFLFHISSAEKLVDVMMNQKPGTSKIMDEMAQSAFKEMSNIFTGAYLNSIADFLKARLLPGIPHITIDMLQSVIDFVLAKVSNYSNEILCIKTRIEVKDLQIEGDFVLFFDIASMNKLLATLKEMFGTS